VNLNINHHHPDLVPVFLPRQETFLMNMSPRRIALMGALSIFIALTTLAVAGWTLLRSQGLSDRDFSGLNPTEIKIDSRGIQSITGETWLATIEAQGFAAAGERMFQMDLMRRKADGSLAELFGPDALVVDRAQVLEDWREYARLAVDNATPVQRGTCEAYARGVNRFINGHKYTAGIEYIVLQSQPAEWTCIDSYLIAMLLSDQMSRSWSRDLDMVAWREKLPVEWFEFVFPTHHPWNKLVFGAEKTRISPALVKLPNRTLHDEDFVINPGHDPRGLNGSNSWAYRGKHGFWLANDPHLATTVPQLWIPVKLVTRQDNWWVTGVAIPGVPGVLIGMNADIAWSITNTAEDIDDAVFETSANITRTATRAIKTRRGGEERVVIRKTPRGPVVKELPDGRLVARQWQVFKTGALTVPIFELNHARDWGSFNAALDGFKFVTLSFTMLDKAANMGLRISGCEPGRQNNGAWAESWQQSTWADSCVTDTRPRLYKPNDGRSETEFIATANERLWDDGKINNWADDDRARRIRELLTAKNALTMDDMRLTQLDTTSEFHRELLRWVLRNAGEEALSGSPGEDWRKWNGDVTACETCMSAADDMSLVFDQIILRTLNMAFANEGSPLPFIRREMKRARVVAAMENPDILPALGLDKGEIANGLVKMSQRDADHPLKAWSERNKWGAQHPFVGRIPVVDRLFAIAPWRQYGAAATIRAERPAHGPSMRIIFRPGHPEDSLWSFPVGTSGHIFSGRFQNWSNLWQTGAMAAPP
jgi:penicillin G amidase